MPGPIPGPIMPGPIIPGPVPQYPMGHPIIPGPMPQPWWPAQPGPPCIMPGPIIIGPWPIIPPGWSECARASADDARSATKTSADSAEVLITAASFPCRVVRAQCLHAAFPGGVDSHQTDRPCRPARRSGGASRRSGAREPRLPSRASARGERLDDPAFGNPAFVPADLSPAQPAGARRPGRGSARGGGAASPRRAPRRERSGRPAHARLRWGRRARYRAASTR